ncbi:DUF6069 family protein [Amorphoplanes digitatis]|uniref:Uncharacterized protein n=1 Tax=Actinoplanes digitatis TaxID=1868 RepID=A0A7W7HZY9_9ACTN|nr:DUF6069 family protein [Actinoplanes digitatis]MBB4763854.1 hypothetical protein [Actinoplanes digitatis]GID95666.1 hypothetical protein Adi01nite_50780 [Actinoplanes digitatis]
MTLPTRTPRPLDAGVLWAGGVAAAFVAALIVIVGILFCRGVLDIPILAPKGEGVWGDADTVTYAGGAAVAALLATGVMHLLLLSTPKSGMFFAWIVSLATLAAMLAPFAVKASQASQFATAALNLVLGIAIGSLVSGSARSAVRKATFVARPPFAGPPYPTR